MLFRRCSKVITGWKPRKTVTKKTKTWRSKSLCICLVFCWSQLQLKMPSLKLTFSPLKMDGWKITSFWGQKAYVQGLLLLGLGTVTESCKWWCCGPELKSLMETGNRCLSRLVLGCKTILYGWNTLGKLTFWTQQKEVDGRWFSSSIGWSFGIKMLMCRVYLPIFTIKINYSCR